MTDAPSQIQRRPIRRIGCIIALVIWFTILLSPCLLIVLAVQQEISVSLGSAPGQQFRLWLISEADQRGVAYSTGSVQQTQPDALCVQTDVRFLLWTGSSEPLSYCECYDRADADAAWSLTNSSSGACSG